MAKTSLSRVTGISVSSTSYIPPLFLAPALANLCLVGSSSQAQSTSNAPFKARPFSTTPSHQKRPVRREKNKSRGVSAIRRTGPRVPLSIAKYELPRPVLDPPARKEFTTNPNHGLWGFFNADKTAMSSPEEELAHGRAWTYAELSYKSFEDLHALYWVCTKERNRIATAKKERDRVFAGYGDFESESRDREVSKTMSRIRALLADRYHSWQEAMAILNKTSLKDLPLDVVGEEAYEEVSEDVDKAEKMSEAEIDELLDETARGKAQQRAPPAAITA